MINVSKHNPMIRSSLVHEKMKSLSKLPGQCSTRFSVLPLVYEDYKNNRTSWTNALHALYGPLVRLSPSEVSICSPASIRDVFTGSAKTGYYNQAAHKPSLAAKSYRSGRARRMRKRHKRRSKVFQASRQRVYSLIRWSWFMKQQGRNVRSVIEQVFAPYI